jgi:hypothetical protein
MIIHVLGVIFIVSYLLALAYGYRHSDDPFWDPFRAGRRAWRERGIK